MNKQYCKVGSTTPLGSGSKTINFLEYQYQNFIEKASNLNNTDTRLGEFFNSKAQKIKKDLEKLIQ